mgnify:CR=1 FL=1
MSDTKKKKGYFAKHSKSSAAMISLGIHAVLILVAVSFVAVTVIQKDEQKFEAKEVNRPKQKLKKLQVPVKVKKNKPKPKLRKRVVVKNVQRKTPEFKMPEITGVKGGLGNVGDGAGGVESIGFTMPEMNFFGAKAKGEKVVFVVHFGPATMEQNDQNNPFTRMTALTIRKRLTDLIEGLPEYTLFNIAAYYAGQCAPMDPQMMLASAGNKQRVSEWMGDANPVEGGVYDHALDNGYGQLAEAAKMSYPKRVDGLPYYSLKWAYPYEVPSSIKKKYVPDAWEGFVHWGRGVAWSILEQKPDTIFILTTNYIDGWSVSAKQSQKDNVPEHPDEPVKMAAALQKMCMDVYGPDKKQWPTINVVVLARAGADGKAANRILSEEFAPIVKRFKGDGSVIDDIKKYMTEAEQDLLRKYQAEYGNLGSGDNDN